MRCRSCGSRIIYRTSV
ncbi:MAG: hypothetical protein H6548_03510 [Chitinophagales bacterium]|nr:hypothetical protein [Chitinophagales bacterium]MCB9021163.1 hypothetical protein [Chitinophagales bacterium]HAE14005.1 hypothetical protein [Bacteroidota bacterium]